MTNGAFKGPGDLLSSLHNIVDAASFLVKKNADPKKGFRALNKVLEAQLVTAGRSLFNSSRGKDLPLAMSAVFLFTKRYLKHLETVDSILDKKPLDEAALEAELGKLSEDILPFLSSAGLEAGELKRIKAIVDKGDAGGILRLLEDTAKPLPAPFKKEFSRLFAILKGSVPSMDLRAPATRDELFLYYTIFAVCVAIAWFFLTYAQALVYRMAYPEREDLSGVFMVTSAVFISLAAFIWRLLAAGRKRKA